jgi:hypothetical protein
MTKRRRGPSLSRLRTSIKRAHNLLDLILPEFNAWRDRIFALERHEFEPDESLDREAAWVADGE